jgi:hypothetical protein
MFIWHYLALDSKALQDKTPGYNIPTSVPAEEMFVPESAPVLPLQRTSQRQSGAKIPRDDRESKPKHLA